MIIACPECSGPFELPDDHIAALVQLECPHCAFRMILDFAAANDPSLVEAGMKMASGFRSAADYRTAAAGVAAEPAEPMLRPVPEPEPEPEPEPGPGPVPELPIAGIPEPMPAPSFPAAAATPAARTPRPAPTTPATVPAPSRAPAAEAPRPAAAAAPIPARGGTVVGPAPAPPEKRHSTLLGAPTPSPPGVRLEVRAEYPDDDAPTQIKGVTEIARQAAAQVRAQATVPASPSEMVPAPGASASAPQPQLRYEPPPEDIETRPEPELELPRAAPMREAPPPRAASFGADVAPADDLDEFEFHRSSPVGTAIVALLLIAALGLVGASVALKNTPDPRPLLEDLYRQYVKQ